MLWGYSNMGPILLAFASALAGSAGSSVGSKIFGGGGQPMPSFNPTDHLHGSPSDFLHPWMPPAAGIPLSTQEHRPLDDLKTTSQPKPGATPDTKNGVGQFSTKDNITNAFMKSVTTALAQRLVMGGQQSPQTYQAPTFGR